MTTKKTISIDFNDLDISNKVWKKTEKKSKIDQIIRVNSKSLKQKLSINLQL